MFVTVNTEIFHSQFVSYLSAMELSYVRLRRCSRHVLANDGKNGKVQKLEGMKIIEKFI